MFYVATDIVLERENLHPRRSWIMYIYFTQWWGLPITYLRSLVPENVSSETNMETASAIYPASW